MTKQQFLIGALVVGLAQTLPTAPFAASNTSNSATEQAVSDSLKQVIFVPHDTGAPKVTDAGGVRGVNKAPKLLVIAPERLARTLSPEPTLYWYTSKATETPVRFTLAVDDPSVIEPLVETEIGTFGQAGIYPISLADHGVALEDDQRYFWSVAVASSDETFSEEPVAQTLLEYSASEKLVSAVETATPLDQVIRYAGEGYWYDAIDLVSKRIETGDQSAPWREIRARLLDQGNLDLAARHDRQ
jgi:hypothetical protein